MDAAVLALGPGQPADDGVSEEEYALLAGLSGAGYAVVFQRTARLEMAALTHFTVNAVHFLLFTYPALA